MDQLLLWGSQNYELLTGIGVGFGILFVIAFPFVVYRRPRIVLSGEEAMIKRAEYYRQDHERRLRERQKICDAFEDAILRLYSRNEITESSYTYWHGHFATLTSSIDFRCMQIPANELKVMLKRRRNGGSYHGMYTPVNLPKADKEVQRVDAIQVFLSNFK